MNLILQAAYKVIDVPVHSCYDIGKDYIMPVFGSILAFLFAFLIMYLQNKKAVESEKKKVKQDKLDFSDFISLTIDKVIEQDKEALNILDIYDRDFRFEKFHGIDRYLMPQSGLKTLLKMDENKIHWTFSEKCVSKDFRILLNDFFTSTHDLNATYERFYLVFEDFKQSHNVIVHVLNKVIDSCYIEFIETISTLPETSNNKLVIKDGLLDVCFNQVMELYRDSSNTVSPLKVYDDLIADVLEKGGNYGFTEMDNNFIKKNLSEIKLKIDELKHLYVNYNTQIIDFKEVIKSSDKEIRMFRDSIN